MLKLGWAPFVLWFLSSTISSMDGVLGVLGDFVVSGDRSALRVSSMRVSN